MFRIVKLCGALAISILVPGCLPSSMLPSATDQTAAGEGPGIVSGDASVGPPGDYSSRCKSAEAVVASPYSEAGQRAIAEQDLKNYNC
jgi:hypothetical protein